jgi:hypothetical protein
MKRLSILIVLMITALLVFGCTSESSDESSTESVKLDQQDQVQLVANALTSGSGGIGDDLDTVTQAADGNVERRAALKNLSASLNMSVEIDFYDAEDNMQAGYDPDTTDRIDYESLISGEISNSDGYFRELSVDNRSDFSVTDILSRTATVNGTHTNYSSYIRNQSLPPAEVTFEMDGELILTDVTVDLDATDSFPESGTLEGTFSGLLEKIGVGWSDIKQFDFHFVCTYIGDNTAEVELDDGTVFTVHLESGAVQDFD